MIAYLFGELFPATEHWVFLIAMLIGAIPIVRRAAGASTPFFDRGADVDSCSRSRDYRRD
jgi:hypothetical protein